MVYHTMYLKIVKYLMTASLRLHVQLLIHNVPRRERMRTLCSNPTVVGSCRVSSRAQSFSSMNKICLNKSKQHGDIVFNFKNTTVHADYLVTGEKPLRKSLSKVVNRNSNQLHYIIQTLL